MAKHKQSAQRSQSKPDRFLRLFNERKIYGKGNVNCDIDAVNQIHGVRIRLNPDKLGGDLIHTVPIAAREFYNVVVKNWLSQHAVLKKAEVRDLGDGLDVILWLDEPIELSSDRDRNAWADLVQVVQSILPISPKHPSINATTRAVRSINSHTGTEVTRLAKGEPVTRDAIVGLYHEMIDKPFAMVMQVMTGKTQLEPCPVCKVEGSSLVADGGHGSCDGECGQVSLGQLYDLVFHLQNA